MPSAGPKLRWRDIALVGIGGSFGTAARYLLTEVIPNWRAVLVATLAINILGAFLLGVLLERLARAGADAGLRHAVRLLVGTGFLGRFTALRVGAGQRDRDAPAVGGSGGRRDVARRTLTQAGT